MPTRGFRFMYWTVYTHPQIFEQDLSLAFCLGLVFLFVLKFSHSLSLPVAPCILVTLLLCLGWIDKRKRKKRNVIFLAAKCKFGPLLLPSLDTLYQDEQWNRQADEIANQHFYLNISISYWDKKSNPF